MSLIIDILKQYQRLEPLNFLIAVVGSRKLSATEGQPWEMLEPNLTILGFDADEDACLLDNKHFTERQVSWQEQYIPLALSDQCQNATIYVTKAIHCSSLYPPNESYLTRFRGMNQGIQVDFTVELETSTLDQFCQGEGIDTIDFLQVDVQGADLSVLRGGQEILSKSILGIQVEVEFAEIYRGQPLFNDVDGFLRGQGFTLFDLVTKDGWCRRPRACSPLFSSQRIGQLLWADALYFRDPIPEDSHPVGQTPDAILKLACIADVLDYPDYALELLTHLTIRHGQDPRYNFALEIQAILSQFPELIEQGLENLPILQHLQPYLP